MKRKIMDSEVRDNDVYGLIGQLCKSLFYKHYQVEEHPYLPPHINNKHLQKLKSKAYEILLKKSSQNYVNNNKSCDPILELLKHAFVIKVGAGLISQATELERYLDEFIDSGLEPNTTTYSTLQFLNELKLIKSQDDYCMDIFHYGKSHPLLPEVIYNKGEVPPFQIYPIESFFLPKKFESNLKLERDSFTKYSTAEPGSKLSLLGLFTSASNSNIQNMRYNSDSVISNISRNITSLNGNNLIIHSSLPQIKDITKVNEQIPIYKEEIAKTKFIHCDKSETELYEIKKQESQELVKNLDKIWENMDKTSPLSNHRTWETLGKSEPPKEPPFISESIEATLHLMNIIHDNILPNKIAANYVITEISSKEFINNVKLLLLGVESNTFIYNSSTGFELKKNIAINSISTGTLENLSYEIIHWGTSFKNLSILIATDKKSGKLQIEGLIFKALCSSIKEFLLFYHAAILRVSIVEDGNIGLLKFLNRVRPLGNLINKVARFCRCDNQILTSLGEGIGILTHIYKEVTRVTEQNVALVYYSTLKTCCEVYFRFLQRWIFEGECTDIYEEFIIKVRTQYLRIRGHRFWTRAFGINQKSVPGFLSELTDSILQCGKAVALLRICNPKNPLCQVSASSQPQIRVCLSVGMLIEQAKFYEEYIIKGEIEQGEKVSLCSAIQEEKETEKRRAELVIEAQKDTLLRLKKEREDAIKQIIKEKNQLLEQLKDQAEEAANRKERDRIAELNSDKVFLKNALKQEEEAKLIERAERENTIKYYNELAEEANRRRIHASWRIRRMKLFDERILAISDLQREFATTPDKFEPLAHFDSTKKEEQKINEEVIKNQRFEETVMLKENNNDSEKERNLNTNNLSISIPLDSTQITVVLNTDENSNPTTIKIDESNFEIKSMVTSITEKQNINSPDKTISKQNTIKAVRPNILEIPGTTCTKNLKDLDRLDGFKTIQATCIENTALNLLNLTKTDNMTEAQRNKLKVLQQEYGVSPNNNKTNILVSMDNSENQPKMSEIQINRLRNTNHLIDLNWDNVEAATRHIKDEDCLNEPRTEIQINRLRNTQHLTHLNWNDPQASETVEKPLLTEAQLNRNKIMSHFYNRMEDLEPVSAKTENLTEWQKNRNRNMAHNTDQFDFEINRFVDNEPAKETPMSTTTDHFTASTYSSSIPIQSCENTPFSEITNHSDILFAKSSNEMSTEDLSQYQSSKYFQSSPVFPNFIGLDSTPNTPSIETQQLTVDDVEMIDTTSLQVYLEKSVMIPLTAQSRLVNSAIIKYLLTEHNMLSHLHSLRSYFFLLNGEFAKTLMQSLFTKLYEVTTPSELLNSSTLTNFLEKALVSSLSSTYANSELLSLSALNIPTHLQTSNPEILSCLSLNYKISWPLNIIFNDMVMLQYSKVFKFLLMVGRVLWVLQEDFQILKIERKASITKNHHKLQLYRHSMMQFMNALHTYLTCSVLHASWSEFEKKLENTMTLEEVHDTHISYIKKILSRCMLNLRGEKMRTCLCNIFKVVLKFHNRIKTQNWNESKSAGPNYENLEKMYIAFSEQRAYLAHVAEKLANTGYQPHLMQFLHALNINHRYNFTSQK
ncbi:PREDICTED: gamma-tubulin complex component 6 [Ceratosolen solmsi marchali]|uniref:Gamma-tubulin complex component 6 n=1 Tax=Ceratosolen solmsi marchali TaxID=326594 RepID=A0AAJ6YS96_9HYME|nr:PREDICTED: gamma-tubulin complex component 6 [Ceratosolen solmsi marchali]